MALRITVPPRRGRDHRELRFPRLAAANLLTAREFCLDWSTTFQLVVDGNEAGIARIADKGGVPAADLLSHAFVRGEKWNYTYRGEHLMRSSLRRKRVAVCASCMQADIASSNLRPSDRSLSVALHGSSTPS